MKRWLVLSSVICLAVMGTALGSVQMGNTELKASGSLFSENAGKQGGLNFDSWMVTGGLGYFLTDNVEVAGVGLFKESTERWNAAGTTTRMLKRDSNLYAFGGQLKYHFMPENQLVPYIGGQALWADAKVSERYNSAPSLNWTRDKQGILWGPLAGLRYELNEQNDVFIEYQYHIWAANIRDIVEDGHAVMLGLTHKFK
jgi:outer membrane protein W